MKYKEEIERLVEEVQKAENSRDEQWNYMAKVYGVDVNDRSDISNFRDNNQWNNDWKQDFEKDYEEYSALTEKVNNISLKVAIVKLMKKNIIVSWDDAVYALDFAMDCIELYRDNIKQTEPQAIKSIADLDKAYNALRDIKELVED